MLHAASTCNQQLIRSRGRSRLQADRQAFAQGILNWLCSGPLLGTVKCLGYAWQNKQKREACEKVSIMSILSVRGTHNRIHIYINEISCWNFVYSYINLLSYYSEFLFLLFTASTHCCSLCAVKHLSYRLSYRYVSIFNLRVDDEIH